MDHHGKKLTVAKKKNIIFDSGKCSGWCDGQEIMIAGKNPLFEETFVHEFSHLTQAIELSPLWRNDYRFWDDLDAGKLDVDSWDSIMDIILLERDCERRAIKFSKKWDLFDNHIYAQRANLYLFYYHYVYLKGEWFPSTNLYSYPPLLQMMPRQLVSISEFKTINMNMMKLYDLAHDKKERKILPKPATLSRIRP